MDDPVQKDGPAVKPIAFALPLVSYAVMSLGATAAWGDYFTPGDILVCASSSMIEYTPAGARIKATPTVAFSSFLPK